ncbi:magnesium transport protein CorA, transmembrane region [Purpureocillium lavendulum]|uniref:Magnesium transport protein CorA, transmembrane region n=1 Tax=Purpureocillium lavendulum TaxID=1247861 RepID=A0AB34FU05_9HYPO|nr:magnesium transport protein CorA, transmembrane region [Purpureocillium lavendulum]
MSSCRTLHPGWQFNLWSDSSGRAFMAEHYPEILPHYTGYGQDIQRANVLRYSILHRYGGVYFDLDITCLTALDETPLMELPFVTPGAHPAGVNNAFILAQPGHPFLSHILAAVPTHDLYWGLPMRLPYVENMFSTGCMFFSNMWMGYVKDVIEGRQEEEVYILADENGNMDPHMWRGMVQSTIMAHAGASSWHSWDAAAIMTLGKHFGLAVTVFASGAALAMVCSIRICLRTRIRRSQSWLEPSGIGMIRKDMSKRDV